MTDASVLRHILQHVESIDERFSLIETELARWRPLLDMFAPAGNGKPDAISVAQGMRGLRGKRRGRQ